MEREKLSLFGKYGTCWGGEGHSEHLTDAEQRELQSIPGPTLDHRQFSAVAGRRVSMYGPTLHGPGRYTSTCKQNSCKAHL